MDPLQQAAHAHEQGRPRADPLKARGPAPKARDERRERARRVLKMGQDTPGARQSAGRLQQEWYVHDRTNPSATSASHSLNTIINHAPTPQTPRSAPPEPPSTKPSTRSAGSEQRDCGPVFNSGTRG